MAFVFTVNEGDEQVGRTGTAPSVPAAMDELRRLVLNIDHYCDAVVNDGGNVATFCPLTFLANEGFTVTLQLA